jgi:hypothetical protein
MRHIRWTPQQMQRLHQAIVMVQGHQYRVFGIPACDYRTLGIIGNVVEYRFEAIPGFRE